MLLPLLILIIFGLVFSKVYCVLTRGKCSSKSNLNGKVALVTGSSRGIGYYTALNLAKRGAKVIITSTNLEDIKRVRDVIIKESGNSNVVAKQLDYLSLDNVRSFVKYMLDTESKLDILVNNAGALGLAQKLTKDGLLPVMQINYFAPFLLTNMLLGLLKNSPSSRIVNLTSMVTHCGIVFNPNNINSPRGFKQHFFEEFEYIYSKICIVSSTIEMAKRLKGQGVTVNCLHPGLAYTDIYQQRSWSGWFADLARHIVMRTAEEGAETIIHLAACEKVEGVTGKYFTECQPSWAWADLSSEVRNLIWKQSVSLCGLKSNEMLI